MSKNIIFFSVHYFFLNSNFFQFAKLNSKIIIFLSISKIMNDQSENFSEFTAYDMKIHSIEEISQIKETNFSKIETLRIMHNPSLNTMKVLH